MIICNHCTDLQCSPDAQSAPGASEERFESRRYEKFSLKTVFYEGRIARNRDLVQTKPVSDRPSTNTMDIRLRMPHVPPNKRFCSGRRVPPVGPVDEITMLTDHIEPWERTGACRRERPHAFSALHTVSAAAVRTRRKAAI